MRYAITFTSTEAEAQLLRNLVARELESDDAVVLTEVESPYSLLPRPLNRAGEDGVIRGRKARR